MYCLILSGIRSNIELINLDRVEKSIHDQSMAEGTYQP